MEYGQVKVLRLKNRGKSVKFKKIEVNVLFKHSLLEFKNNGSNVFFLTKKGLH